MKNLNHGRSISPIELIRKVESAPPVPLIWKGIKKGGLGFIFGPSKTGKTIVSENLAYNIALRNNQFLDSELNTHDEKVFFISLEEPNIEKRGERNSKALSQFSNEELQQIDDNLDFVDEYEQHIWTPDQWEDLISDIRRTNADIVFIDSLTHLYLGEIENSTFAQELTQRIRSAVDDLGITLIIVHHTPKLHGRPITIDSLAGSRVLAQEAEFMIGINKGANGSRYLKDVAYRFQREKELVTQFKITNNFWIESQSTIPESRLLQEFDGRVDPTNRNQIFDFIKAKAEDSKDGLVTTATIKEEFPDLGDTTVHESLDKLIEENKIVREKIGNYRLT